jgi:hypothetical protein
MAKKAKKAKKSASKKAKKQTSKKRTGKKSVSKKAAKKINSKRGMKKAKTGKTARTAGRTAILVEWRHSTELIFETAEAASEFEKKPLVELEFDISQCDDNNAKLNVKPLVKFPIRLKEFRLARRENVCDVSPYFRFEVEIDASKTKADFDDWAYNDGGMYCVGATPVGFNAEYGSGQTYFGTKDEYGRQLAKSRSSPR